MGESRGELLKWINDLCQLSLNKIEECGTGAPYCQIMDSIYGDLPLHRVKFDAKGEHEFLNNFKILQNVFAKHKVDKVIPVDKLVKLKMQDNLEFVQWLKRYWESNSSGDYYDAVARRKAAPGGAAPASSARAPPARTATRPPAPAARSTPKPTAAKPTSRGASSASQTRSGVSSGGPIKSQTASPRRTPQQQSREVENLIAQLTDLSSSFDAMKSERDFYFDKLRDIEILTQKQSSMGFKEDSFVKQIQAVLYSTEEGFELPSPEEQQDEFANNNYLPYDDEETF
ncbi:hypothetical protein CONCODRAFT_77861 [Conidiobolus coronatus NRRL 28638]|uniref:Microtubule binding protein n=1 Tax=Conidiobolus coronatus (strain ATCC 28846 / CBS 209.66 / NRRL 28638) TaxID=796925 RepID=A0A137PBA8_CONC2|nr:hypothetical protein CONCODRAFT_77861 [Conidiobolus coronatus NRRL 28638]|eukprot:KXN72264.1 hypothetical protein CONCODRAFT_77861 [Conidiobolus coronatus NRRL 28638]